MLTHELMLGLRHVYTVHQRAEGMVELDLHVDIRELEIL